MENFEDTCSIHNCKLDGVGEVPVFYGFFGNGVEYGRAFLELFRYSRSWRAGGCSVATGRPNSETVKYCTQCREVELQWLADFIGKNSDETELAWAVAKIYRLV